MTAPRPAHVSVVKHCGRWVVSVRIPVEGGRTRHRQKFMKRANADAHADAIRARLRSGLPPFSTAAESRPTVTVLDVLQAYPKTPRGDQHVEAFRKTALAGKAAERFELADLEGFLEERGYLKTCAKDFSFLKRACRYAKAKGRIASHYFEKIEGDKTTRRRLMPTSRIEESPGREIPDWPRLWRS